jgi:hypothetical protein
VKVQIIVSILIMAFVILGPMVGLSYAQTAEDKPNILLIVGDDIGFGDLGISGSVVRITSSSSVCGGRSSITTSTFGRLKTELT